MIPPSGLKRYRFVIVLILLTAAPALARKMVMQAQDPIGFADEVTSAMPVPETPDQLLERHGLRSDSALLRYFQELSASAYGPEEWIAALGHDSFRVRENATQQLTFYPLSPTLRETLKTLTGSPDPEIRLRAEKILAENNPKDPHRLLDAVCSHMQTRSEPLPGLTEPLLTLLQQSAYESRHGKLQRLLAQNLFVDDLPLLSAALPKSPPPLRLELLTLIDTHWPDKAVDTLSPLLSDADDAFRFECAILLLNRRHLPALNTLSDLLTSNDENLRKGAIALLRQCSGQEFAYDPLANEANRADTAARWKAWSQEQSDPGLLQLPVLFASASLNEGLVLHLTFNGSVQDRSGAGQTLRNPIPWTKTGDRFGTAERAAAFDGRSGGITVLDSDTLDTDEAFTLALWIRIDGDQDEEKLDGFLLSKWNSSAVTGDYILRIGKGRIPALTIGTRAPKFQQDSVVSPQALPQGEWLHLVGVFDHGALRLYQDGTLLAEKANSAIQRCEPGEYNNDDLRIGSLWNDRYNFHGMIDDVRIYKRALTPAEIKALHASSRSHDPEE